MAKMKKILRGLLFFTLGILIEVIVILTRWNGVEHIKLSAITVLYFVSGLLISRFETKVVPYPLLFLFPSLYVLVYSAFDNPSVLISLASEFVTLLPAFAIGFYFFRLRRNLRLPATVLLVGISTIYIFLLNPQLIFKAYSSNDINPRIEAKKIDYSFISQDSSVISSSMLENKVVLLDYWFIRCGPCLKKMKELKKIASHFKGRKDVIILAVDDGLRDKFSDFLKTSKTLPAELDYAYDSKGRSVSELDIQYFPHEILLDKKGNVRHQIVGFNTDLAITYTKNTIQQIESLLNEK